MELSAVGSDTAGYCPLYRMRHPEDPHLADLTKYENFMRQHPRENGGVFRLLLQKGE